MAIRLKTLKQMQASGLVPWSKPKVMELITLGNFPKPRICASGPRGHLWDEGEVEIAMEKIIADAPRAIDAKRQQTLEENSRRAATSKKAKASQPTGAT